MEELSAFKHVETRSRFFAHLYRIDSMGEIDLIQKSHKRLYKKANHHCFALRFRDASGEMVEYSKDDGEVGHPGKSLLEMMRKSNLNSHVLMVSRVFGGVKLGVGNVTRAFRTAGGSAISQL